MGSRTYAERHTVAFLEELAARVGHVTLCAPEVLVPDGTPVHGRELTGTRGISVVTMRWRANLKALFYALSLFWLLRTVRRADFVYVFLPGRLGVVAAWAATLLRRPFGVYLRGSDLDSFGVRFCLSRARFVLATGPFLRELAARHCEASEVVSPMFDIGASDLQPDRAQRRTRTRWQLLYVGSLEEAKGTYELLRAVEILGERGVPVELQLVGGWTDAHAGRQLEAATRRDANVRFAGVVNDRKQVRQHFLEADLFVFPSHSEGFPRVLYEAMAFGVPVVTTLVDGIASVMQPGVNCLAVPARDPSGLADAIQVAVEDVALRERLAAGGLSTMARLFAQHEPSHAEQVIERVRAGAARPRPRRDRP